MKRCKKCKAIISLDLIDVIKGTETPKCVTKESVKIGFCKDCYNLWLKCK